MAITAIFFDLGGVIVRTTDKLSRTRLAAEFGMSYVEMDSFVFDCKTAELASIGSISEEEHWLDVTRRLNLPESEMPRIQKAFFDGDSIDQDLVDFLREQRQTVQTCLISNAWSGLRSWIQANGFADAFDHMIISAELGVVKPDPRIYRFAMEKINVRPDEAVFVDDVEKNILGCEAVGMRGILFKTAAETINQLRAVLNT